MEDLSRHIIDIDHDFDRVSWSGLAEIREVYTNMMKPNGEHYEIWILATPERAFYSLAII